MLPCYVLNVFLLQTKEINHISLKWQLKVYVSGGVWNGEKGQPTDQLLLFDLFSQGSKNEQE